MFGIAMFLMKDWRNTPGTAEVLPYLDKVRGPENPTPHDPFRKKTIIIILTVHFLFKTVLPCLRCCRESTWRGETIWGHRSR
jgi:hypothetical protein